MISVHVRSAAFVEPGVSRKRFLVYNHAHASFGMPHIISIISDFGKNTTYLFTVTPTYRSKTEIR